MVRLPQFYPRFVQILCSLFLTRRIRADVCHFRAHRDKYPELGNDTAKNT